MAPIVLYSTRRTPAGRAVELTAKMIGLELDVQYIDLAKKEQLTPEFLKMNPMHTVPTVNDNGVPLYDSHAIIIYLVSKYAKDDSLYPKTDLVKQANINALLHFESGVLFARLRWILEPVFYWGQTEIPQEKIDSVLKAYELLEATLTNAGTDYLVGNSLTLADISVSTSLSTLNVLFPADATKHPKVLAYLKRLEQTMPNYKEINTDRANEALLLYNQKLGKA
ncbi:glutathione S-transferase 1-like [Anopheles nili]|uniref:glutathione S-transferase 1-like n=1 Tax=Anopheles nili TaxID=185578 RepID=UPI00237C3E96|nr:glutathione S-transferase 1-like [Anopheles nili]